METIENTKKSLESTSSTETQQSKKVISEAKEAKMSMKRLAVFFDRIEDSTPNYELGYN